MGGELLAVYDDAGNASELYLLGSGIIGSVVETEEGGYEVLYQLYDARGSVTSRIDSEGELQKGTEYDAFGNRQEKTGEEPELEDRMSYTGAEYVDKRRPPNGWDTDPNERETKKQRSNRRAKNRAKASSLATKSVLLPVKLSIRAFSVWPVVALMFDTSSSLMSCNIV